MHDLAEGLDGRGADPPGRRLRSDQFRVSIFERLELAQQPIVFGIGYQRIIERVLAVVVVVDVVTQLRDALRDCPWRCHFMP